MAWLRWLMLGGDCSDNNEYLLHNDDYVPHWDDATRKYNAFEGKTNVGTLGRMYNVSIDVGTVPRPSQLTQLLNAHTDPTDGQDKSRCLSRCQPGSKNIRLDSLRERRDIPLCQFDVVWR